MPICYTFSSENLRHSFYFALLRTVHLISLYTETLAWHTHSNVYENQAMQFSWPTNNDIMRLRLLAGLAQPKKHLTALVTIVYLGKRKCACRI